MGPHCRRARSVNLSERQVPFAQAAASNDAKDCFSQGRALNRLFAKVMSSDVHGARPGLTDGCRRRRRLAKGKT